MSMIRIVVGLVSIEVEHEGTNEARGVVIDEIIEQALTAFNSIAMVEPEFDEIQLDS